MNDQPMTLDQIRDFCAEKAGWQMEGPPNWRKVFWKPPKWPDCNESLCDHPFTPDMNGAVKAFDELCKTKGWEWGRSVTVHEGERWDACNDVDDRSGFVKIKGTGNPAFDLFNLVYHIIKATSKGGD